MHENSMSAHKRYKDKVMTNVKKEVLKRNIKFGLFELIEQISFSRNKYSIFLKQSGVSDFDLIF